MPKILLLTGDENEARGLQEILGDYAGLVRVRGLSEMESHLKEGNCDVLFCAWPFYRAFWNGELQEMRDRYPALPVVVLSHTGGEREWLEVLDAGAFDLLSLPCQKPALLGVIEQAVVSHQVRKVRRFEGMRQAEQRVSGSSRTIPMGVLCRHRRQTTPRRDETGECRRCLQRATRIPWSRGDDFPSRAETSQTIPIP